MKLAFCCLLIGGLFLTNTTYGQHMEMTAAVNGNNIVVKLKPVDGDLVIGWSDIEFFLRNPTSSPTPNFSTATITINTADFPSIVLPYNGINAFGTEIGYTNYWFGYSFAATAARTYLEEHEYILCVITLTSPPTGTNLELCHNEPNFTPHYLALTDNHGADVSQLSGENKFYGTDAAICDPNCPLTTSGINHILPLTGTSLPVELLDFTAEKTGRQQVNLQWETAVETQFKSFGIERSSNGTNWLSIGTELAKGHGGNYFYTDKNPPAGNLYYRLNMEDLDGSRDYSPIRVVAFDEPTSLSVYPNPTSAIIHLVWSDGIEVQRELQLFDATGRLILAQTTEKNQTFIDISAMAAGAYWLRINTGTHTSNQRIIRL